ncbi:GNAT family N-acetyltransferase [Haloferax namakaokahaiae]|uniref:GNAT family N-acetyltransferase n=1 Tax=Haloferax namakaokahaiae TaxID=1748331 RepID=A0ABD5ZJC3_9EURY
MNSDVVIRPPRSRADMRGVWRVNVRCWNEAYGHIFADRVLPSLDEPPSISSLGERLVYATSLNESGTGRYVVAVDESGDETDGELKDGPDEGDHVVGFAAARWGEDTKSFVGDDEAGLWILYVDPDWWGRGIGTRLLETVEAAIPEAYTALVLDTLAENEVGRRFYRARGFEVRETMQIEIGGDPYSAVILARPLRS